MVTRRSVSSSLIAISFLLPFFGNACVDNSDWATKSKKHPRNCTWVGENPSKRCKKKGKINGEKFEAVQACKKTCNSCNQISMPSSRPSSSPVIVDDRPPIDLFPVDLPPIDLPPIDRPPVDFPPVDFPDFGGDLMMDITWTQCTSNYSCTNNGYDALKDCRGDNSNCPQGEFCNVTCSWAGTTFCYDNYTDECEIPKESCHSSPCNGGKLCVDNFSFECGNRVCKNTTIQSDLEACDGTSFCKTTQDCGHTDFVCVSLYQDCGIAL